MQGGNVRAAFMTTLDLFFFQVVCARQLQITIDPKQSPAALRQPHPRFWTVFPQRICHGSHVDDLVPVACSGFGRGGLNPHSVAARYHPPCNRKGRRCKLAARWLHTGRACFPCRSLRKTLQLERH